MMEKTSSRRQWFLAGIVAAFVLISVGWPAAYMYVLFRAHSRLLESLPAEAAKVSDLVDAVYEYRDDQGAWPGDLSQLSPRYVSVVQAPGWKYHHVKGPGGGAMLQWQGPLHSKLVYVFSPDANEGWRASSEGSPLPIRIEQASRK
jgi:hypothetical protein